MPENSQQWWPEEFRLITRDTPHGLPTLAMLIAEGFHEARLRTNPREGWTVNNMSKEEFLYITGMRAVDYHRYIDTWTETMSVYSKVVKQQGRINDMDKMMEFLRELCFTPAHYRSAYRFNRFLSLRANGENRDPNVRAFFTLAALLLARHNATDCLRAKPYVNLSQFTF